MKSVQKIELAMQLVITAFSGIRRTGPIDIPASTHSLRVGLSLITYEYPLEVVIGGFCHDLIEDTNVTAKMIERLFNYQVRYLVESCTFNPSLGERAGEEILNLRVIGLAENGEVRPLRIKCADCLDNLKTNHQLKPESQISAFKSGALRLAAAKRFMPQELLTHDLDIIVARERSRLNM
jgi:(p)ppGpp synthase/HD superfamily hydrolase